MRRTDAVLLVVALAFGAFLVRQTLASRASRPAVTIIPDDSAAGNRTASSPNEVVVDAGALPAPERNIAAVVAKVRARAHETYIGEILAARDSNIGRWPGRPNDPVRVWVDERPPLADFDPAFPSEVRRAFTEWGAAGVPLRFTFVSDSSRAEVHVTFVDRFEGMMSGRTRWERTPHWWIVGGDIALSLRSGSGQLLDAAQLHAIALHEVGHLLGLDHTADPDAVMAPSVRTLALSPRDIATMRLIYDVPPGSLRTRR